MLLMKQLQEMSGLYGIQMIYFSSRMDAYGVWSAEKIWHSFFCRHKYCFQYTAIKEYEMGLEQWGASEQYYKIASGYPEYELGRVISQEKDIYIV